MEVVVFSTVLLFCLSGSFSLSLPTGPPGRMMSEVEPSPLTLEPAGFRASGFDLPDRAGEDVLLVVAASLETPLAPELAQFAADLAGEGFDVSQVTMTGGTVEDLRFMLQSQSELDGVILIGNLPSAWYEDTWSDAPHEEFPMDLFLMDLNGTWSDGDGDGKYDSHTGNRAPEIWTGRIDAHAMEMGSEIQMLRDYFAKNHLYRTGVLQVPGRGLTFIDDDWSYYYGACGLNAIYTDLTVDNSDSWTTADNYLARLDTGYEFVHLMSHSSPWGHTFKVPSGYGGTVMAPEITLADPPTVFVQLFACSNCRWTEPDCLGNWYLFGTGYGLLVFGSTKTGALLEFEELYTPMGEGEIPGEAFRMWFTSVGIYNPDWHYGCVMLGDPTLMPLSSRDLDRQQVASGGSPLFESYTKVSTSSHSDCYPTVTSGNGMTWVAWATAENGRLDIAARAWDGDSWSQVYIVDADEYWDVAPDLTVDSNGTPWLAWADFEYSSYGYRIRTATGNYLTDVSTAANGDGYDVDPHLAFTDRMWLVWQVWRRGEGDIMVKALDGSFPETWLTSQGSSCFSPAACASPDGLVHAAWVEGDVQGERIMWTSGDENGFEEPVELSSGDFCRAPALATCNGIIILAWQDCTDGTSIRVRVLGSGGWGSEETLFSAASGHACVPAPGTSPEGAPLVAWQWGNGAGAEIWQSTLTASGWSDPAMLVDPDGPAWLPALCDGVAAWSGTAGSDDWDIYIALGGGMGAGGQETGNAPDFRIMGNPVSGSLHIAPVVQVQGSLPVEIGVFDITGRSVKTLPASVWTGEDLLVDCSDLPSGIYVIRVSTPGSVWTGWMTVLR
jgi:hypothetical protein